jgi:3-dehydroquinate synthase
MESIPVNLGQRSYEIAIEPGLIDRAGQQVKAALAGEGRSAVIVTNPTIARLYGARTERSFKKAGFRTHRVLAGDGERFKTLKSAELLYTFLIQNNIERGDVIVALGGGVIGDLAGLVAATYLRGVDCVQIPTTFLAQIDSSIGGKTGVNHRLGKNLIGAFHQPIAVVIDPEVLTTLPRRQLRSGLFEAIKYGVIWDKEFLFRLGSQIESLKEADIGLLTGVITTSCRIKAQVVEQDEREGGLRRILNFGHTAGHALEAVTNYRRFLHGEAIGHGMRAASRLAELMGILASEHRKAVDDVILSVGSLPSTVNLACRDIMDAMKRDKKVVAGNLAFVLPVEVGRAIVRTDVPPKLVRKALKDVLA